MKKEPNKSMNEGATMPSYFPCIKSSESHPLADWLYLKSVITVYHQYSVPTIFQVVTPISFLKKVILVSFLG